MRKYKIIGLIVAMILIIETLIVNSTNKIYAATLQNKFDLSPQIDIIVKNQYQPEKFDLRSQIDIVVKNQYQNGVCPHMSRSSMVETHVKLGQKNGIYDFFKETPVFSVLTYKTVGNYVPVSIDKTEKVIQDIYGDKMKTEDDILKVEGECNNKELLSKLSELEPSIDVLAIEQPNTPNILNEKFFKGISKEYTDTGIIYKDEKGNELSDEQVKEQRAEYKNHIMKNGGLRCSVHTKRI